MIESVLLTTVRVSTFDAKRPLSAASGFFFEREGRLFLVTSRHVVIDHPSRHFPNRIEIELHTDPKNLTSAVRLRCRCSSTARALAAGQRCRGRNRRGGDQTGSRGVAGVGGDEMFHTGASAAFAPGGGSRHLATDRRVPARVPRCAAPPARGAACGIASSFGLRFQGLGYFLTDARTHRGTSGAPVVMRSPSTERNCPGNCSGCTPRAWTWAVATYNSMRRWG